MQRGSYFKAKPLKETYLGEVLRLEKVQWGEVLYSETMYPPVPEFTALGYMALA